ncbi:MAG: Rossmann-like and DUF2520 domain-containing protein [Bacteroidota bacterium]|nr:Rossmann-like and DUF2520 domain-containing protein [Bacteroidota bacterium]
MIKKIILIGSGNVATHLGKKLKSSNYNIIQVFSRKKESAKHLAKELNANFTNKINEIMEADLMIVSIKDTEIARIIRQLPNIPVAHTSGSISINVFAEKFTNYGVIYPLQTFNKDIKLEYDIPFCIEANNKKFEKKLNEITQGISKNVCIMNSEDRKTLHIAAVFACNFSNHMYTIANTLLDKKNIPFSMLLPLIQQTNSKLKYDKPKNLQTGPAKRQDIKVIKSHINSLKDKKLKEIYNLISNHIIDDE